MSVGPGVSEDASSSEPPAHGLADASARLRDLSGRADIPSGDFDRIADALGGQPEAVRLAARLLAVRPNADADLYLEALTEHADAAPESTEFPKSYRAAVLTSFEIVEHDPAMQGHAATSLLALAAYLPPGPLPEAALAGPLDRLPPEVRPFADDRALRDQALDLLDRLGLVERSERGETFAVVELTKAVVRDLLAEAGETSTWQAAAAAIQQAPVLHAEPNGEDSTQIASPPATTKRDAALAELETAANLAANGGIADALARYQAAHRVFAALADAAPEDLQAQADLAAIHAKIGVTQAAAGRPLEGLASLASCRRIIADLEVREPGNALWSTYLDTLDGQIADLVRIADAQQSVPPPPPTPEPRLASASGDAESPLHRLVQALNEPAPAADDDDEPAMLVGPLDASDDEEPLPLEVDDSRDPPKVFTSDSLFAEEAGLVPPAPPPPRRSGIISRLFGRRD